MITIFSIEFDDSTNQVIDWLDYYSATWKRINSEDIENEIEIIVKTHDSNQLDKKNTVWFRKWRKTTDEINHETKDVYIELNKGIEFEQFSNYLFHCHSNGYWLNHPNNLAYDKITQLNRAKTIGIEIPPTLFTNSKTELLEFIKKYTAIITKPLNASILVQSRGKNLINYTRIVDKQEINQLEEYFYPSLFQKFIDKEFEIRSFYLEGNFYSMAIFSQNDERTKIDFRHYNFEKPNRNVSYQLPKEIEQKLSRLMKVLRINSGSLDLIKAKSGEYIFLEVNPLGQFGMTSTPCNYFLEKKIAQLLINKTNEKQKNNK